ncbi:OmpA family protein [Mesorhizobium sp.]|uniref:OmpA family protein n=1 Tax=Mesorhizobium sp. TaxID=1871066 RepID=UPI001200B34F|nr:OmpA family protein [Mesorhizobium sp.]TIR07891.1 MAG: flagellar motor protein MotB [Mesorhizobium sp.]
MKRQPRILAGTAIGLLMASAPLGAYPLQADLGPSRGTPFILAQSNCAEGQSAEECAQGQQGQAEQPRKKKREQQTESAPAEQSAEPEQKPRRKRQDQQQSGQAEEAAPAEQQLKPRKKRDQQQQIEAAPADQGGQAATDEQQPRKKKRQQQTETAPAEQPAEQAAPASDEQQPRRKKRQQQQTETAPAEQAPKTEAPAGEAQQAEPQQDNQQAAPAEGEQPSDKTKRRKMVGEQPGTGQAVTGEQPSTQQPSSEGQATSQPATGEQPAEGGANAGAAAQGEAPANANEAPILDSQKDVVRKRKGRQPAGQNENGQAGVEQGGNQAGQQGGNQAEQRPAAVDQGPPPTDDKAAQQAIKPEKLVPVTEEKGKRIELTPEQVVRERRRPQGADVVKQFGDRVILQFNNQTFVESNEAPRITRGARDVYYEDLPRGRTRETVERENGVKIVTIRNRNGDIVQRSRITPDGREYVLSYVDERYYQDVDDWRDPGDDLPPMRLDISRRDYILDSEEVEDPDEYYTFLEQPPVERVQRLYSIDEVKRSARVRDIARRIDLDTLNFDFGSATLSDTEVQKLEGVATAMDKLLKKNPAETFLIEGHTDAVGTPDANLALSDRRAEAVAEALTNAFGVPAENLTTQGYGEEYLKVNTSSPNRENRRVAIRRITSLVAPVASNEQ